jgi:hypothetical protein
MPLTPEEQFLSGGGVVSMSFRGTPPISIEGFVIGEPVLQQQRDFETSKPVFWGDGGGTTDDAFDIQGQPRRPVMQLAVKLQTAWRNGEGAPRPETVQNDDGIRGVYLAFERQKAVSEALSRVPGMRGLHGGDWLRLTFYAEDHARQVGKKNPPKLFSAEVRQSDRQPQDDMWASAPETYAKAPQVAPPAYSQPGSGYGAPAPDPYSLPPAPASNGWGAPAGYAENPALQQQQQQPLRPLPAPAAAAPPAPAPAPAPAPIHLEAPQVQTISDEILRTLGPGAILGLKAAGQIPANWGDE